MAATATLSIFVSAAVLVVLELVGVRVRGFGLLLVGIFVYAALGYWQRVDANVQRDRKRKAQLDADPEMQALREEAMPFDPVARARLQDIERARRERWAREARERQAARDASSQPEPPPSEVD